MAQGEMYVEVDASVVNGGIAPMAFVSGKQQPVEGQESFGVWLRWQYNDENGDGGFTGQDWFWNDPNNPLSESFPGDTGLQDFKAMLVQDKPQDLDRYLGNWGSERKAAFFEKNQGQLGSGGCFAFD